MLLCGKNAIITGANRGIGRALVDVFAANGANIWAHSRKETASFRPVRLTKPLWLPK
jgi:3-oxoacyl-[acyl-carrier protein] reductase